MAGMEAERALLGEAVVDFLRQCDVADRVPDHGQPVLGREDMDIPGIEHFLRSDPEALG
jgi:hypothetical protein